IQQFYERADLKTQQEPDAMTAVLGQKPPTQKLELTDFGDRIRLRAGELMVINDEAHHTHDEENEWNKRSEERRVGKERRSTRSKRDWSSDVCSSDLYSAVL